MILPGIELARERQAELRREAAEARQGRLADCRPNGANRPLLRLLRPPFTRR